MRHIQICQRQGSNNLNGDRDGSLEGNPRSRQNGASPLGSISMISMAPRAGGCVPVGNNRVDRKPEQRVLRHTLDQGANPVLDSALSSPLSPSLGSPLTSALT